MDLHKKLMVLNGRLYMSSKQKGKIIENQTLTFSGGQKRNGNSVTAHDCKCSTLLNIIEFSAKSGSALNIIIILVFSKEHI